ncbi:MAG TPA: DUF1559 domain-containing protein, partial [Gemmataceae bacterium]
SSLLLTPSDKVAVYLSGLKPDEFGKPRPADKTGPLSAAIRAAATGRHLAVFATTLANLPDEIRGDTVPPEARPFKPLFDAQTIAATLDLGKELKLEVRVKAATAPRAGEAEKSLGVLAELGQTHLGDGLKEIAEHNGNDAGMKDLSAILTAMRTGLKGAKFATEGDEARATVAMRADLPIVNAYLSAKLKVKEAAVRAQSFNNLKQIGIAMHSYHDTYGSLPPAAVCDKKGKPILSWRVLILPYIEEASLYKEFKLDEPWDSEHNKKLIAKMPKVYTLPFPTKAKANETHYRVWTGNGAAFDYLKGCKLTEFLDGTSNTLMVVTAKDAVPWTKPDELAFDPEKDMTQLLGYFGGICAAACGDGSTRALNKNIDKKTLNGLITKDGGEIVGNGE